MAEILARRGQVKPTGAGSAAVFIAIVTTLIIIYILFLPPDERAAILGDDQGPGPGGPPGQGRAGQVIFSQRVGRLDAPQTRELVHALPAFTVLTRQAAQQLKEVGSLTVQNGGFSDVTREVTFFADLMLQDNLALAFNVQEAGGRLQIALNGQTILDRRMPLGSVEPISLARDDVQTQNSLKFSVSGPGAAFWRTNRYVLSNLVIAADVKDMSQAQSELHFTMSRDELEGAERITLEYWPRCQASAAFFVTLNAHNLFSGQPACQVLQELEIAPEALRSGDNVALFSTAGGTFLIDQVAVRTRLRAPTYPVYYANVPARLAEALAARQAHAVLSLRFADRGSVKRGTVTVNGNTVSFNTAELYWVADMGGFLVPGSNSIKILPLSSNLEIAELRLELR